MFPNNFSFFFFLNFHNRNQILKSRSSCSIRFSLVANRNVLKPLKTYSLCFEDLTHLVEIVDISQYSAPPPDKPNANAPNR